MWGLKSGSNFFITLVLWDTVWLWVSRPLHMKLAAAIIGTQTVVRLVLLAGIKTGSFSALSCCFSPPSLWWWWWTVFSFFFLSDYWPCVTSPHPCLHLLSLHYFLLTWCSIVESVQFGLRMWNMPPLERMNRLYVTLALQPLFFWGPAAAPRSLRAD